MNERIKEIAQLAWDATRDKIGYFVDDSGEVNWDFIDIYDQTFAKMIITECAEYFGREGTGRFDVDGNWIAKHIKQQWDIKE